MCAAIIGVIGTILGTFLFFYLVILLCLFWSFILQGGMRTFGIVEVHKTGDSPHQIRFRRIVPAV